MSARSTGGSPGEAPPGDRAGSVDELLAGLEGRLPAAAPGAADHDDWYASTATSARELAIVVEPGY